MGKKSKEPVEAVPIVDEAPGDHFEEAAPSPKRKKGRAAPASDEAIPFAISTSFKVYDVPTDKLHENHWNPNVETVETFNRLTRELKEEGFDQNITGIPCGCSEIDGFHINIIKGEHRWKAAKVNGDETVPVYIRLSWDESKAKLKTVLDNNLRGQTDRQKLTELVNGLSKVYDLPYSKFADEMGYNSEDDFMKHFIADKKRKDAAVRAAIRTNERELRMVDDLSHVLNDLFADYGSTIPQGYMLFFYGGQQHLIVECEPDAATVLTAMDEHLKETGEDVSVFLARAVGKALDAELAAHVRPAAKKKKAEAAQ